MQSRCNLAVAWLRPDFIYHVALQRVVPNVVSLRAVKTLPMLRANLKVEPWAVASTCRARCLRARSVLFECGRAVARHLPIDVHALQILGAGAFLPYCPVDCLLAVIASHADIQDNCRVRCCPASQRRLVHSASAARASPSSPPWTPCTHPGRDGAGRVSRRLGAQPAGNCLSSVSNRVKVLN